MPPEVLQLIMSGRFGSPLAALVAAREGAAASAGQGASRPAAPPAGPAPSRGIIDTAVAGPADPRLSQAENDLARRRALLGAGAAGLLATSQNRGLLNTVGTALATGQAIGVREAESILASRPEPDEAETQVVTRSDGSMVLVNKRTGAVIAPISDPPDKEIAEPKPVQTLQGDIVLASWDPDVGSYRTQDGQLLPRAIPVTEDVRGVAIEFMDEEGNVFSQFADPTTGEGIGPVRLKRRVEFEAPEGTALAREMRERFNSIAGIVAERGGVPFGVMEEAIENRNLPLPDVINEALRSRFTGPQVQQFSADADAFVQIMVKAREGGRPSDKDREFILNFVKPRASDDPQTWQLKLRRMEQIMRFSEEEGTEAAFDFAMRMAGREPEQGARSPSVAPGGDFNDLIPGGGG